MSDRPRLRFGFRYRYLRRLIDDNELADFPPLQRARVRRTHKRAFWKNVRLLRRDAARIVRARRGAMVRDYLRVHFVLFRLALAGVAHGFHMEAGQSLARQACDDMETLLRAPRTNAPVARVNSSRLPV